MGPCSKGSSRFSIRTSREPGSPLVCSAKVFRNSDSSYLGGFACEYAGNVSVEEAEANLQEADATAF
jgi:hypothetical protein